jgi:hypothetical protein
MDWQEKTTQALREPSQGSSSVGAGGEQTAASELHNWTLTTADDTPTFTS